MSWDKTTNDIRNQRYMYPFHTYYGQGTNDSSSRPYQLYCWLDSGCLYYDCVRRDQDCDLPDYIETNVISLQKDNCNWPVARDGLVSVVFMSESEFLPSDPENKDWYLDQHKSIVLDMMTLTVEVKKNRIVGVLTCLTPEYKVILDEFEEAEDEGDEEHINPVS